MSEGVKPEDVQRFQQIIFQLYQIKLTDDEARREIIRLKRITRLICPKMPLSATGSPNQNSP